MASPAQATTPEAPDHRRVAPVVALALLEVIRDQDLPMEVLADEDVSTTMPRRLGLSEVIESQIRRYREEVRKRRRVSDSEFQDLVRLVVRRPDSEEVFRLVGERLADTDGEPGWLRFLPRTAVLALARRQARRRLKALFGRSVGQLHGPFVMEGRNLLFLRSDPGGDACMLVSGMLEAVVSRHLGEGVRVVHESCQAHKEELCRWTAVEDAAPATEVKPGDLPSESEPEVA